MVAINYSLVVCVCVCVCMVISGEVLLLSDYTVSRQGDEMAS